MVDGKMEQTGACLIGQADETKVRPIPTSKDNINLEGFKGECVKKEGDIFVSAPTSITERKENPHLYRVTKKDELGGPEQ